MSEAAPLPAQENAALTPEDEVRANVVHMLKTVFDPEIPVDIYELGLIYGIDLEKNPDGTFKAGIRMTLTSPHCPAAAELPQMVQIAVQTVEGISETKVDIVWDPTWDKSMMSEEARLALGFY
jgi:FeS assembly SUF system protein